MTNPLRMCCKVARDLQWILQNYDKSIGNVLQIYDGFAMDFLYTWQIRCKYVAKTQQICNGSVTNPLQIGCKFAMDLQWNFLIP